MTQTLSFISTAATRWRSAAGRWLGRWTGGGRVAIRLRLDRSTPGAHLMWDIANEGATPITLTRLVLRTHGDTGEGVPLAQPHLLRSHEQVLIPTDVDWTLLSARSIAVADAEGREHRVSRRQLAAIQQQLRTLIERRVYVPSARDWLSGAADMAFGFVILGLGFFMLMWVIATG
jgi:hypothetical protein